VRGSTETNAYIEAIRLPDSVRYPAFSDSAGMFEIRYIPEGRYLIRAYSDANKNRAVDAREAWDTVSVAVPVSGLTRLHIFAHDSIVGPGMTSPPVVVDSQTIRINIDPAAHPTQQITPSMFSLVRTSDSGVIPIARVLRPAEYDSLQAIARQKADTSRPPVVAPPPKPPALPGPAPIRIERPIPITQLILQTSLPLKPGVKYRLRMKEVVGLIGATRESTREFTVEAEEKK
jgi:hypothetical protein